MNLIKYIKNHDHLNTISLCLSWYFISSLTSQSTKYILNQFNFPVFVGECQFFFSAILGIFASIIFDKYPNLSKKFPNHSIPSEKLSFKRSIFKITLPMGFFQFFGKLFGLAATSLITVGTVASVRSLSPLLIVLGYKFYYRVQFPLITYISLIPLVLGVVIIVITQTRSSNNNYNNKLDNVDPTNHIKGILFAFTSAIIFAIQSIYAKNVVTAPPKRIRHNSVVIDPGTLAISDITDEKNLFSNSLPYFEKINKKPSSLNLSSQQDYLQEIEKPDKLTTLVYCAIFGFTLSFPVFLITEFTKLLTQDKLIKTSSLISGNELISKIPYIKLIPWKLLILNGTSHFLQALVAFHILGALPTVTYSIASMMKRIVIIIISMIITGNMPSFLEFIGLINIGVGLYTYDKWGSHKR